ncbi:cytochrome P450 [Actinomadura sp. DC4]|uniref:cytochrome P450 n=1 Tax=Actinomadura sp. DC4 TaxID=3055069 RepID=UPI0025B1A9F9|nr:cytochrome P450 [Actinomadura sp. DC4]MDN3354757.1 cytochrome P450 [Actinomadura sp. DC4]
MAKRFPLDEPHGLTFDRRLDEIREAEPVCQVSLPYGEDAWLVTRYEDVRTVLADPRFSRAETVDRDVPRTHEHHAAGGIVDLDPPEHTRVRRVVAKAFTVRRVERLRPRAEATAGGLLDAMIAAGPPADLVRDFAVPFPTTVICELLGVPYEDRGKFVRWTDAFMSTTALTPEQRDTRLGELAHYLGELVAQRRRSPTDDLLGALVVAHDEESRLSEQELIELATVLLAAGHESTSSQIGNFVYTLLAHPDQLALVRDDPSLLSGAVEELLRYIPLMTTETELPRYATVDVPLEGGTVPAGRAVLPLYSVANRDPRAFPDPARLDVRREMAQAQLGLGHGAHHCVGAQLARMELQVALGSLLARLPGLRLAVPEEELRWKHGMATRGLLGLPVTWDAPSS